MPEGVIFGRVICRKPQIPNRRVVLSERPDGLPDAKTLQLEHKEVPIPGAGQMLLRTRYLSLDPYMRGRM